MRSVFLFQLILLYCAPRTVYGGFNLSGFAAALNNTNLSAFLPNGGTVDLDGNHVAPSAKTSRGYTYDACLIVCGSGVATENFTTVAGQMALWFLPYLTLLAQSPYVTSSPFEDIFVAILTLGSPLLALYSLFVTGLNWRWIEKSCGGQERVPGAGDFILLDILPDILGRLQQYPIVVQNPQLLASALAVEENSPWWTSLQERLRYRERRLDASGLAQLCLAIVVYLLALVEAFAKLGGITQGLSTFL